MNTTLAVALIVAWVVVGLMSGLWMARHGHDPLWTLIAVVLGPLFVPIAITGTAPSRGRQVRISWGSAATVGGQNRVAYIGRARRID